MGGLSGFDKRGDGREIYSDSGSQGQKFFEVLDNIKELNIECSALSLHSDNWGCIQVAYETVKEDPGSKWKDYDCFYAVLCTAWATGLAWIVVCSIQFHALRTDWVGFGVSVIF